ncbi:MAG: hypothetical protein IJM21_10465 [Clostridia bacterium]|nr:hypothetical protein [Clostridia bacterium]
MRKAAILLLIALVLPFSACGKAEPFTQESESAPEETAVSLPDAMPEDFAVRFETWFVPERKNVLDTFEGKIEKDLVEDGRAEAVFTPSEPLREELYETIRESGIASIRRSMTSHVLATGDERVSCEPLSCWRVVFRAGGKTYRVDGDATAWFYRETVPDAGRFAAFCEKMNELLRSLPEFRALPEPRGAYE